MTRFDFLYELRQGLKDFSEEEIMEHIVYYREMIEDRIEDGMTEAEALKEIGTPEEVVARIYAETPLPKLVKTKLRQKPHLRTWEIVLLALGCPIWLSILISVIAVIISLFAVVFSVVISLYAIAVSFVACGVAGVLATVPMFIVQNPLSGFAALGLGLFFTGGAILMFLCCNSVSKLCAQLIRKFILWIKSLFVRKENAK